MKRVSILAAGVLSAAMNSGGWALGLGELNLRSYLNEPFRADVALLDSDAFDDNDLLVGLASEVEFERLGISRDFFLTRINFQVESDEMGRRVVLTTEAPLREPYLDLVVEARWPDGRLLREYTVLIDLPPRPMVAEGQDAPADEGAQFGIQTIVPEPEPEPASAQTDGYSTGATVRPTAGAQYLVTNTDTLWRIASEGAAAGISVQQTMLEIVAANPAAFEAGNINGLKSGYVLQIPDYDDIQIDPEAALSEVALQNEEWEHAIASESPGLTLVADGDPAAAGAAVTRLGEPDAGDPAPLAESGTGITSQAPLDVSSTSTAEELEALIMTVSRLQQSVDSLEAKLAERDAELVSLRSAIAEQQAANPAPIVEAPSVQRSQLMPLWPFLAGLTTLSVGAGLLIWRRLRRNAESEPVGRAGLTDVSPTAEIDEASNPSRFSDPQVMASKAVEEAQTYIAYGRTDQAVEVLNDALAEGLASVALNVCLLECYVELEQFAEAGALLERLEKGGDPVSLKRVRQMLHDAGVHRASSSEDAAEQAGERAEATQGASVLSELSFSTEPTFEEKESFPSEQLVESSQSAPLIDDERELAVAMREGADDGPARETTAGSVMPGDGTAVAQSSPDTSGLALTPRDHDKEAAEAPVTDCFDMDESIYGLETNPVDSKLDLARAYLDMGDEDGARPVLMEVIKEGDLAQQAEARELFLRLEAT